MALHLALASKKPYFAFTPPSLPHNCFHWPPGPRSPALVPGGCLAGLGSKPGYLTLSSIDPFPNTFTPLPPRRSSFF